MLSAPGLRAVVLETFGAGNAPTNEWFIRVLKEAIGRGIIILNITPVSYTHLTLPTKLEV